METTELKVRRKAVKFGNDLNIGMDYTLPHEVFSPQPCSMHLVKQAVTQPISSNMFYFISIAFAPLVEILIASFMKNNTYCMRLW